MTQFSRKNNITIRCVAVYRIAFQPIEMTENQSQRFNVMTRDKIDALTYNPHNIIMRRVTRVKRLKITAEVAAGLPAVE